MRVAGRTAWVAQRVFSTSLLTFYAHTCTCGKCRCHAKRGQKAFKAIGWLTIAPAASAGVGFLGRRVHDPAPGGGGRCAWGHYLNLTGFAKRALCNAHLLRVLIGLKEDTSQAWVAQLIRLLLSMQAAVAEAQAAGRTALPPKYLAAYEAADTRFIQEGLRANPPPKPTGRRGRPKQTPARNLLDRLVTHRAVILASRSVHDFRVPPQGQSPGRT